MTNMSQTQDEDSRKRSMRLAIIVVAHLLVVATFFTLAFFRNWNS